jgi:hypothetical protein
MKLDHPTVAFTIGMRNAIDGPAYFVYTQAYGLEMTMDDEWPINTIIMSPPHLISSMTEDADVASMGAIAGASYTPGDGDYAQIADAGGKWVLARKTDNIARILDAGLGVLLHVDESDELDEALNDGRLDSTNLIVAFQINSVSTLDTARKTANSIRKRLAKRNTADCQILVSGSFEHSDLLKYAKLPAVAGLLLLDTSYDAVIGLLRQIAG